MITGLLAMCSRAKLRCLVLGATAVAAFTLPMAARAAVVYTAPTEVTANPGQVVPITVQFSSEGEAINVLEASIFYPTDLLDAVAVTRGESFLSLWAEEPSIDAAAGKVSFVGGIPNGSVVHHSPAVSVIFRAKRTGRALIRFDPFHSSAYLNDGGGTQAALTTEGTTVTIANADPLLPTILSSTHPDEGAWSSIRTAQFQWVASPGAFYSYHLRRTPNEEPDEFQDGTGGNATYPELMDGIWYFSLRQRLPQEDWSPSVSRRLLIDGTPPEPFQPEVAEEGTGRSLVSFVAADATSGVAFYEARILRPRSSWFPFFFRGGWERAVSPIELGNHGVYQSITIRAIDAAGNVRTAAVVNPDLAGEQRRFLLAAAGILLVLLLGVVLAMRARRRIRSTIHPPRS